MNGANGRQNHSVASAGVNPKWKTTTHSAAKMRSPVSGRISPVRAGATLAEVTVAVLGSGRRPAGARQPPRLGGGRSPDVADVAGGQFHAALGGADDEPAVPVDGLGPALQRR